MHLIKKIFLLLTMLVIVVVAIWFLLANKFETTVRTVYLPLLQKQNLKSLIHLDFNNVDINKYTFKVVLKDVTVFPNSGIVNTAIDELSIYYNFLNQQVTFFSSGKKISMGSGETEVYVANPSILWTLPKSLLDGDINNFSINIHNKFMEVLKAKDNTRLLFSKKSDSKIIGKLNESTNQYSLKFETDIKGRREGEYYAQWLHQLSQKSLNENFETSIHQYPNQWPHALLHKLVMSTDAVDYAGFITINLNNQILIDIYKTLNGTMKAQDFLANFNMEKELFNVLSNIKISNDFFTKKFSFYLLNDGKKINTGISFSDNNKYSKNIILYRTKKISALLMEIFNKANSQFDTKNLDLTLEDLKPLASLIANIRHQDFDANFTYEFQNSAINGDLHSGIQDHVFDFKIGNPKKNIYTLDVKLSDPLKLTDDSIKFIRIGLFPIIEKLQGDDKAEFYRLQKNISYIEKNGSEAFKAFNKNLMTDREFESHFTLDLDKYEVKVNDKLLENVIKNSDFFKGFPND